MVRSALTMFLLFSARTRLGYPLSMTGLGQLVFPRQANRSSIEANGKLNLALDREQR